MPHLSDPREPQHPHVVESEQRLARLQLAPQLAEWLAHAIRAPLARVDAVRLHPRAKQLLALESSRPHRLATPDLGGAPGGYLLIWNLAAGQVAEMSLEDRLLRRTARGMSGGTRRVYSV